MLTEQEQAGVYGERLPLTNCVGILESKILEESERVISGRRAGQEALDRERELARGIRGLSLGLGAGAQGIPNPEQRPKT